MPNRKKGRQDTEVIKQLARARTIQRFGGKTPGELRAERLELRRKGKHPNSVERLPHLVKKVKTTEG
jgi:hypothetical protein